MVESLEISPTGEHIFDAQNTGLASSQLNQIAIQEPILDMRNITKAFGIVHALDDVNLAVQQGEVHALVGENGAGKSTLMKVLSGVYPHGSYKGSIFYEGHEQSFRSITDSENIGIIIIHQELALIPQMTIAENIFLLNAPSRFGIIDKKEVYQRTKQVLKKVGLSESPDTIVGTLGVGKQQLVEIAKALAKDVKLLILDEPTASLNEKDSAALLELLKDFRAHNITSILISHKLNEITEVADQITVLRDGKTVANVNCHQEKIDEDWIIRKMVDRDMDSRYPKRDVKKGDVVLAVEDWWVEHPSQAGRIMVDHVSLEVHAGEVLGIAGLMGAGRTEFAMSLFGRSYGRNIRGTAKIKGKIVDLSNVNKAIAAGLAYVTEDRKQLGLLLDEDIRQNITLANLKAIANKRVIDSHKEIKVAGNYRDRIRIRSHSIYQEASKLSGGNQQKVVLSKWLFTGSDILILDEPTRGIDVGAKYEIYTLINNLAEEGKAVIVISSEMPELLGICDRILVMHEGQFVGEVSGDDATQEKQMSNNTSSQPSGSSIGTFLKRHLRESGMLLSLAVIVVFFQIVTGGVFLKPLNLTNIVLQNSYIIIMALGMLLVIVTGHIDLSVGSLCGFIGAIAAVMMVKWGMPFFIAALLCLVIGGMVGAVQGGFVAFFKIPSFIVTLAGMLVFKGLMIALLGGQSVGPFSSVFQKLSSGFIPEIIGVVDGVYMTSFILGLILAFFIVWQLHQTRRVNALHEMEVEPLFLFIIKAIIIVVVIAYLSLLLASHRGLPNVLIIMAFLIAIYAFITNRTILGRQIYAVGGNFKAAKLSGVKTERLTFFAFINMGVLAALAGLVFAARLNTATPKAGIGFELDVIAACFIGGASAYGGVGKVTGAVIGAFIMGVMNNGMSMLGIGIDYQQVIKGIVLLGAVFIDVYNKRSA